MRKLQQATRATAALAITIAAGCVSANTTPSGDPALKAQFREGFMVGAAVNEAQFSGRDAQGATLVKSHFNSISPENALKWERVHPEPGTYDFAPADRYVAFGEKNGMFIVGHTLVWHNQVPAWVFADSAGVPVSRDTLMARLHDHIATVVGRYRGRIKGWDVVNEALNEDGTMRDTPWRRIIGDDYIATAFRWAHEADPSAQLYYNDYSLENAPKRDAAVRLVRGLLAQGIPVTAIGTQEHDKMDWPSTAQMDSMFDAFAATGLRVHVTELDVDVLPRVLPTVGAEVTMRGTATAETNPYAAGLPDSVQRALSRRYGELFSNYWKHRDVIDRVTFWGVSDRDSWLNNWPIPGRTNYPLIFDRDRNPKPAFAAVLAVTR
jgi:endo-1,4-beta-xylanase